ncbi:MAG: hypothetical protein IKR98_04170 [Bacteroidaceae bacterium]|nr:hypothetical protein [Bacteroidaceae bacterium]
MKRFITILCCITLTAISMRAQDDADISAMRSMNEIVVVADGQSFEEYLVTQVLENAKPLKEHIRTLNYTVTTSLEKDIDLKQMPRRRIITFAARLAGYGQIASALLEHKAFGITMAEDVLFHDGKITTSNARIVESKQQLTEKQMKAFLKHDGIMGVNIYDKFYDKVRSKAKELKRKYKKKKATGMVYVGSYTSDSCTIYKVKLDNMLVHIVDGCWQIKALDYTEGQNQMHFECSEVRPGLFVLSKGTMKMYIDRKKWPQGSVAMQMTYEYR